MLGSTGHKSLNYNSCFGINKVLDVKTLVPLFIWNKVNEHNNNEIRGDEIPTGRGKGWKYPFYQTK